MSLRLSTSLLAFAFLAGCAGAPSRPPAGTGAAPAAAAPSPGVVANDNLNAVAWSQTAIEHDLIYLQTYRDAQSRLLAALHDPDWDALASDDRAVPGKGLPPAVVLDIDETVLDNSPSNAHDAADGRTYSPAEWKKWTALGSAKALPGAVDFLNYAVSQGCAVFYISNREMDEEEATIRNLVAEGFPMADEAHVMPMEGTSDKTARRAAVAKGHYIALLVGDQLTDFDESFKARGYDQGKPHVDALNDTLQRYFIMLPNSMYGTWLNAISGPDSLKVVNKEGWLRHLGYR